MISLDKTFEDMKDEIEFTHYLVDEVVSPNENPEYFKDSFFSSKESKLFNKKYLYRLFEKIDPRHATNYEFFTVFGELETNAFMHGNKWDPELPIHIKILEGKKGYLIQIEDCGDGFNVKEKLDSMVKGEQYSRLGGGNGFKQIVYYSGESNVVSYEGMGNIANFMFKAKSN